MPKDTTMRRQEMPYYTAEEFKLAVISVDEITDEQVERIFMDTVIETEDDITTACDMLKKHRSALYQKIGSEFPLFRRGGL